RTTGVIHMMSVNRSAAAAWIMVVAVAPAAAQPTYQTAFPSQWITFTSSGGPAGTAGGRTFMFTIAPTNFDTLYCGPSGGNSPAITLSGGSPTPLTTASSFFGTVPWTGTRPYPYPLPPGFSG